MYKNSFRIEAVDIWNHSSNSGAKWRLTPPRRTRAALKACPETFRWELENLTTFVLNNLGCVSNFPITEVPEIMKYEDFNIACVYFHINMTFSTNLPRLLNTIPCQFLLRPFLRVGTALEPLDLRHYLNSSLLWMGAAGCGIWITFLFGYWNGFILFFIYIQDVKMKTTVPRTVGTVVKHSRHM